MRTITKVIQKMTTEEYEVIVPATFDEEGILLTEEITETRTKKVPTFEKVTRAMTPEEEEMYFPTVLSQPTQLDKIEAQLLYTALLTDSLIEGA